MKKLVTVLLVLATIAKADAPRTLERRRDIEAALVQFDRDRTPGNVVVGTGLLSMAVGAFCGGYAAGLIMEDTTRLAFGTLVSPLTGSLPAPRTTQIESMLGVGIATGVGGFVALMTGLLMRHAMAPAEKKRALLLESARLEGELRAERRLAVPAAEEPIATSTVEQPVEPPPAPSRRVPLRPR